MTLFHREFGEKSLPPVVLLHGLLGSARNWQMIGRDLAETHHVFALDLRNHGGSSHADEMTYAAMVEDVLAWMDTQGLLRVTLIGHSMGGKMAMLLACRHPERVERLVVVDIAPKDYLSFAHRAEFAAMLEMRPETLRNRAEAELRLEARVPNLAMRKFLITNLEPLEGEGFRWIVNLPVLAAALGDLEKDPLLSADRFTGPVLFVAGGRSRYVEPGDWDTMQRRFPKADLEIIAEAGHNPHMDAREEFLRILRTFLVSGPSA